MFHPGRSRTLVADNLTQPLEQRRTREKDRQQKSDKSKFHISMMKAETRAVAMAPWFRSMKYERYVVESRMA
jgi:hypothetical protein